MNFDDYPRLKPLFAEEYPNSPANKNNLALSFDSLKQSYFSMIRQRGRTLKLRLLSEKELRRRLDVVWDGFLLTQTREACLVAFEEHKDLN